MHDDVLLISFTTTPRSHVVFIRHVFSTFHADILFNSCSLGTYLHFESEA